MAESKTYVFGNDSTTGGNGMLGLLAPLLQKQGLDPNMVMAMMNNRSNGFGGEGGWFMWIIFLFFLMGWGNNGFGGFGNRNGGTGTDGLSNLINNDAGRELLMQAIQGNNTAINQLSSNLNCSIGDVQQAINSVLNSVQQVGNQVGQSGLQVINAIQSGNSTIASQLASCCCENRLAICNQTNTLQQAINALGYANEKNFSTLNYNSAQQTCDIRDAIRENTAQVLAGQRSAELRELQREIAERDRTISEQAATISNGQQTAIFSQMINQAVTPLATAINGLQKNVDSVMCKLPDTTTVAYSPVTAIPSCVAAQYGLSNLSGIGVTSLWG